MARSPVTRPRRRSSAISSSQRLAGSPQPPPAGTQPEAKIFGDQLERAVGRVAPAAAAGQLHGQPCAGLERDVALGEDRLAILEHIARPAMLAADDTEAGVLHMLAGEIDVHLPWRDVAEDQALTEPAPEFPPPAGSG